MPQRPSSRIGQRPIRPYRHSAGPAVNRADFSWMPRVSCSLARTTAAPRHARSPKPLTLTSTCCSATSAQKPDCSGKPSSYRSPISLTNSAERGNEWSHGTDEEELARHFVGQLYDVVVEHRGLLLTLVASETLSEDEITDAGIADITRALGVLGQISAEGMRLRGLRAGRPDLPAHTTVATIAGMVALRSTFFGANQPSREAIVDELVEAILHGFLHRCD